MLTLFADAQQGHLEMKTGGIYASPTLGTSRGRTTSLP